MVQNLDNLTISCRQLVSQFISYFANGNLRCVLKYFSFTIHYRQIFRVLLLPFVGLPSFLMSLFYFVTSTITDYFTLILLCLSC